MIEVGKSRFEDFLSARLTQSEPVADTDINHSYETWLDWDDNEVAFTVHKDGEVISYHIQESA